MATPKTPPIRELLAGLLRKRADAIRRRLMTLIEESPELADIHELARSRDYQAALTSLLELMAANIADPSDRRCFHFAEQRALTRYHGDISATQMLRIYSLQRQVIMKTMSRAFGAEPTELRRMTDLLEEQTRELELALTSAHQTSRDRRWQESEIRYFSLFENAAEAMLSFRPGDGRIIEANVQAERLLGQPRNDLLDASFAELFLPEHREQVAWLVAQPGGTSNMRLEDMDIRRADGATVPVSLSCNWVNVEDVAVAQIILRDTTQLRQMQRELQSYAEQLEERVTERTRALRESEERTRELFVQEQRRARHLSLINDVQQCALVTREVGTFIHAVVAVVQSHFRECDVIFYLCQNASEYASLADVLADAEPPNESSKNETESSGCRDLTVAAEVGGHGLAQPVGARHPLGEGLPGRAATHCETLYVANDTADDERYLRAPGVHRETLAQLCVPVTIEGDIVGVLCVDSPEKDVFDPRDAVALQTSAMIAAAHIQSSRIMHDVQEVKEFNETLIGTMLHSLMVLGANGAIQIVNDRLCQTLHRTREELINQPFEAIFSEQVLERHHLREALKDVTDNGVTYELPEVRVRHDDNELVFDVRLSRVNFRGQAQVVVLLINLTQRWRQTQQLMLMNEMGRSLQASLDINRVLHTVLTCITAGPALGFNRAFLLLLDDDGAVLEGAMALGPSSAEEASEIWRELGRRQPSLQDMLANDSSFDLQHLSELQLRTRDLRVNLQNPGLELLARAVRESRALKVTRGELIAPLAQYSTDAAMRNAITELFTAQEMVIAPLVAKERIVGVIMADNLYSSAPIGEDDVRMLDTVARQAGLTVDNALTYQALQKAQSELMSAERLVAVGEMAARISHEIRNPLATVGGFARSILRKPDSRKDVVRKAGIIVDEVNRLEELLTDLLDMARAKELDLQPNKLNEVVEHALLLADADLKANNAEVVRELAPDLPMGLLDRRRLLQALLNTLRNGAQAMPEGGDLRIATSLRHSGARDYFVIEIQDSGVGIPERTRQKIFDPFFSTKMRGSGLGLAVTLRIIRDHGGDIDVFSEPGQGTRFVMSLPVMSEALPEAADPGPKVERLAQ